MIKDKKWSRGVILSEIVGLLCSAFASSIYYSTWNLIVKLGPQIFGIEVERNRNDQ